MSERRRGRGFFINTQAKTIDLDSHLSRPKSLVLFPVLGENLREEEEGEGKEGEKGKMMLKIDKITHFPVIEKSLNAIKICVSEAPTTAQSRDFC